MSIISKLKSAIIRHEAGVIGERVGNQKGPVMEWIRTHKTQIGIGFGMLSAGLMASPWASQATPVLSILSAFLVGAGILTSDKHAKEGQ